MVYDAEISRANPTCLIFLLDQSGSMADRWGGGSGGQKADVVASTLNRFLKTTVIACTRDDGVRDYLHVGVIGYGEMVGPALGGKLVGRDLVPISAIAEASRIEERTKKEYDGAGGLIDVPIKFAVWLDPVAKDGTPMCQALRYVDNILSDWLAQHPTCYPPLVFNITDGESTDGNPAPQAEAIRQMASDNGNVLLFNLHLSSSQATPIVFPDSEVGLPDEFALLLFRISSPLPDSMIALARQKEYQVSTGARGFIFNADIEQMVQFIDLGTKRDLR